MAPAGFSVDGFTLRAAIFQKEGGKPVQGANVSAVNDLTAVSLPIEQSCDGQRVQMKGQCGRGKAELFGNSACRRAFGTPAHEEPDDVEPCILRQGRQALDYS